MWSCLSKFKGGHGDALRVGAALFWKQAERAWASAQAELRQPGKEKALQRP